MGSSFCKTGRVAECSKWNAPTFESSYTVFISPRGLGVPGDCSRNTVAQRVLLLLSSQWRRNITSSSIFLSFSVRKACPIPETTTRKSSLNTDIDAKDCDLRQAH